MAPPVLFLILALLLSACGGGEAVPGYSIDTAAARAEETPTLPPISLPTDEAPHDNLTEWWYYTGHLDAEGGRSYGFELVTFQVVRGRIPRTYLAHFAITDISHKHFTYDEQLESGPQPQPRQGFRLETGGIAMSGLNGRDTLRASMKDYAVDLALSGRKPPALHEGDGIISFGPAGDSYYYSRTRMAVSGTITDHGERLRVSGQAWFDHQWGDFISVAGGGWDWYSVQLDDGADLTVSVVRDMTGERLLTYGTYVHPDGAYEDLRAEEFTVESTGTWTSPRTGSTYPTDWRIAIPNKKLTLALEPVIPDQELDTRKTTGVAYWEGAVAITGTRAGEPIKGRGYVELTGYDQPRRSADP